MQFDAIRRAPDEVRHRTYEFLHVATDFKPPISEEGKNAARAPRFPALQSGAQSLYNGVSALPGVGAILKSPAVAKRLQDVYHRFNSKAQKYAPLTAEERAKWEDYYAVVDGAAIFLPDRHELVETGVNQFADFLRVSFSARAVKPEISENRIVTSLRSSALATSAASFWARLLSQRVDRGIDHCVAEQRALRFQPGNCRDEVFEFVVFRHGRLSWLRPLIMKRSS